MANLFWKTPKGTNSLLETPFKSEQEFEKVVFDTTELLEDIFLIRRQVRGGGKTGIPDIVGVDTDGNICIVEMKNVPVGPSIIPQVLEYAIWADANPDSIKSLWLESTNKPDDLELDWDSFEVRILIVAPSIQRTTLQFVQRINYAVDLIEIRRWVESENHFLMVNKLEPEIARTRTRPAKGLQEYDEEHYKQRYGREAAEDFLRYVEDTEALLAEQGWTLEKKFNRSNCAFKAGFFNAFAIRFFNSRSFGFFMPISEDEAKRAGFPPSRHKVVKGRHRAFYDIEPGKTHVRDFIPLIELCYRKLGG